MKVSLPHIVKSASKNKTDGVVPSPTGTGGRIITVSATLHYTGQPMQAHVTAAKAAVDSLAASVAIEYGPLGVTSNIIAPGPIAGTEGMNRLGKKTDRPGKGIPLNRFGTVKEIADATVYLFSDSGNYVNSEVLVVDGGAWRTSRFAGGFDYPDFILSGEVSLFSTSLATMRGRLTLIIVACYRGRRIEIGEIKTVGLTGGCARLVSQIYSVHFFVSVRHIIHNGLSGVSLFHPGKHMQSTPSKSNKRFEDSFISGRS